MGQEERFRPIEALELVGERGHPVGPDHTEVMAASR